MGKVAMSRARSVPTRQHRIAEEQVPLVVFPWRCCILQELQGWSAANPENWRKLRTRGPSARMWGFATVAKFDRT